jgi:hypothetical protein
MAILELIYLFKMEIFHGYAPKNQRVWIPPLKSHGWNNEEELLLLFLIQLCLWPLCQEEESRRGRGGLAVKDERMDLLMVIYNR